MRCHKPPALPVQDIENIIFGSGQSVSNMFRDCSYGKTTLSIDSSQVRAVHARWGLLEKQLLAPPRRKMT